MSKEAYEAFTTVQKEIRSTGAHQALRWMQKRIHDLEIAVLASGRKPSDVKPLTDQQSYEAGLSRTFVGTKGGE